MSHQIKGSGCNTSRLTLNWENVMHRGRSNGAAETGVPERRIGRRYLQVAVAVVVIAIFATGGMNSAWAQQGATPSNPAPAPAGSKPNILMIMSDDIGELQGVPHSPKAGIVQS